MDRRMLLRDTMRAKNEALRELHKIKPRAEEKRSESWDAYLDGRSENGAKLFAQFQVLNAERNRLERTADECERTISLVKSAYATQAALKRRANLAAALSKLRIPDPIETATKLAVATAMLEDALQTTHLVEGASGEKNKVRQNEAAMREVFGNQSVEFLISRERQET